MPSTKRATEAESPAESKTPPTVFECLDIEQAAAAREARVTILKDLTELSDGDVILVRDFMDLVNENMGNAQTPVQDFIIDLPGHWKREMKTNGCGLTPDDIIYFIENPDGCRSWFDDAISIAQDFSRKYPALVAAEAKEDR